MSNSQALEKLLGSVFDDLRAGSRAELSPEDYARRRHDFVFHMLDWQDDLEKLAGLFRRPNSIEEDGASTLLVGFLSHVVPHLNAAGRLLLDQIDDPFISSSSLPATNE